MTHLKSFSNRIVLVSVLLTMIGSCSKSSNISTTADEVVIEVNPDFFIKAGLQIRCTSTDNLSALEKKIFGEKPTQNPTLQPNAETKKDPRFNVSPFFSTLYSVASIELHFKQMWRDLREFYSLVGVFEKFFNIKKAGH